MSCRAKHDVPEGKGHNGLPVGAFFAIVVVKFIRKGSSMSLADYYLLRVYELKPGVEARELEQLAASGLAEMQGWVAGVKRFSLLRLHEEGAPAPAETRTVKQTA